MFCRERSNVVGIIDKVGLSAWTNLQGLFREYLDKRKSVFPPLHIVQLTNLYYRREKLKWQSLTTAFGLAMVGWTKTSRKGTVGHIRRPFFGECRVAAIDQITRPPIQAMGQ